MMLCHADAQRGRDQDIDAFGDAAGNDFRADGVGADETKWSVLLGSGFSKSAERP
jgi:hypothetical protein